MVSVKSVIAAGAAAFISTAACAADMALPPPPQIPYQPVAVSGWYLRGDIGVGMTDAFTLDYLPNPLNPPNNFAFQHHSMADTMFYNFGVGYELNNWLRFDVTGEYRAKTGGQRVRHLYVWRWCVRRCLSGQPELLGRAGQRLRRSRHLVVRHAVRRRRHRRRLQHHERPHRHWDWPVGDRHRPQQRLLEPRLGALCRPHLQRDAEFQGRSHLPLPQLRLGHRYRSTAPAAAIRTPTSSATCPRRTSCWACASCCCRNRCR